MNNQIFKRFCSSVRYITYDYRLGNIPSKPKMYDPGLGINSKKVNLSKCYCFSDRRKISDCYCLTDFYNKKISIQDNINLKNRNNLF